MPSNNTDNHASTACYNAQIQIQPKNQSSTVLIDIQSRFGSKINIDINYDKNEPFSNKYIIQNKTNLITTKEDNSIDIIPSLPIHPITILCRNANSCQRGEIRIGSLDYLKLYCLSDTSCDKLSLDFISHNNDNRGELDVICTGQSSCLNSEINALTTQKFGM